MQHFRIKEDKELKKIKAITSVDDFAGTEACHYKLESESEYKLESESERDKSRPYIRVIGIGT